MSSRPRSPDVHANSPTGLAANPGTSALASVKDTEVISLAELDHQGSGGGVVAESNTALPNSVDG